MFPVKRHSLRFGIILEDIKIFINLYIFNLILIFLERQSFPWPLVISIMFPTEPEQAPEARRSNIYKTFCQSCAIQQKTPGDWRRMKDIEGSQPQTVKSGRKTEFPTKCSEQQQHKANMVEWLSCSWASSGFHQVWFPLMTSFFQPTRAASSYPKRYHHILMGGN